MVEEKKRFSITNLFRRSTPKPADRQIFNIGIQERRNQQMMTAPIIYSMVQQSVIVRTCVTQLKQEIFRRGYVWEKAYEALCQDCGKKHQKPVTECTRCGSENLRVPDPKQLEYIEKFLEQNVNKSEQLFIDVLKELERLGVPVEEIGSEGFGSVIRDEDYVVAAASHKGMRSGLIDKITFGRNEPALHHYHNTFREALDYQKLPLIEL